MFQVRNFWVNTGLAIASIFIANPLLPLSATPLEEIQKRGKITIAVKDNVRPLGFRDSAGNLQGLEIDLARQLAQEILGDANAVELIPLNNQERLDALLNGEVDVIIAQMGLSDSRERLVNFSSYYYLDGIGFVTKKEGLTDLAQITTQRVVILNYSQAIAAVRAYFPNVTLIPAASYQEALTLLETQQADLFAGDHSVLTGWTQDYPNYRLLPAWLDGNALAIATPKGRQHQTLHQEIQTTLLEWQKSGWLKERINHWGLP